MRLRNKILSLALLGLLTLGGCTTYTGQQDAVGGAVAGALIGGLTRGPAGAVIGGAAGAAAGGIYGDSVERSQGGYYAPRPCYPHYVPGPFLGYDGYGRPYYGQGHTVCY